MTKFFASVDFFLVIFTFAIAADAIALDAKEACGAPWNLLHHEGSPCKFWGKDSNGIHVHDGTCHHEGTRLLLFKQYVCNTTSVDLSRLRTTPIFDCRNVANNTGTSTLDPHSNFGVIYAFAVNFVFSRRRFLSVTLKTGSTDSWTGVALWIQLNYHQETYFHQNEAGPPTRINTHLILQAPFYMKFLASISFFLVIMAANINVNAIALDAKLACGVPWNIRHEEGTPCKFWGKDDSGTHVHDGTCKKRDGFHLIHSLECNTTSVDLLPSLLMPQNEYIGILHHLEYNTSKGTSVWVLRDEVGLENWATVYTHVSSKLEPPPNKQINWKYRLQVQTRYNTKIQNSVLVWRGSRIREQHAPSSSNQNRSCRW
ncbi:hypothetical protein GGU10DRAFT_336951 [Lentinula aff. detonsa]|uniref:Cyanovirin-N domain-containing protein n=1 Tax=Lentinula aff. detonsa TaxID=2804958 RepID=A0AA38KTM0_9AGAR|nr:hypothetical protein GGU10DRAFT_336951 [Lentinula aff. detonsa]